MIRQHRPHNSLLNLLIIQYTVETVNNRQYPNQSLNAYQSPRSETNIHRLPTPPFSLVTPFTESSLQLFENYRYILKNAGTEADFYIVILYYHVLDEGCPCVRGSNQV